MLYIPKYYVKILWASLRSTVDGFVPDKSSLMKSILTTAVFWLILVYAKIPLAERITEAAALAVAIVLTFLFYAILDLIATPARQDRDKSGEIDGLSSKLKTHTDRAALRSYLVGMAVVFRDLEVKLASKDIDHDEYLSSAKEGYEKIRTDLSARPDKDFIEYRIGDLSAANTLAPSMIPMMASNLVGKLGLEKDVAEDVSKYLCFRQNLDGLISNLAS